MKAANHYQVIDVTNWANLTTITRTFRTGAFAFGPIVAPASIPYSGINITVGALQTVPVSVTVLIQFSADGGTTWANKLTFVCNFTGVAGRDGVVNRLFTCAHDLLPYYQSITKIKGTVTVTSDCQLTFNFLKGV